MIGDSISIKIISTEGNQVKIGIEAPRHVEIHRQEVYEAIQQENQLAGAPSSLSMDQVKKLSGSLKIEKR